MTNCKSEETSCLKADRWAGWLINWGNGETTTLVAPFYMTPLRGMYDAPTKGLRIDPRFKGDYDQEASGVVAVLFSGNVMQCNAALTIVLIN